MYTKKVKSLSKSVLAFLLIGLLTAIMGCNQVNPKIILPPPLLNTLDFVKSINFSESIIVPDSLATDSLAKYIADNPVLTDLFQSGEERTLFAPSNKAFKNLLNNPNLPFKNSDIGSINPLLFQNLISYHVVEGTKFKKDLTEGTELSSIFKDPLSSTPDIPEKILIGPEGTIIGLLNPSIRIAGSDNKSTNGIFHVLSSDVLIPPSILSTFRKISGTLAASILISGEFSIISELIQIADRDYVEDPDQGKLKVASLLAAPLSTFAPYRRRLPNGIENGLTFFAIPDNVISTSLQGRESFLREFTNSANPAEFARRFLLNHLVLGQYKVADIMDKATLNNLTGGLPSVGSTSLTVKREIANPPANPLGISIKTEKQLTAIIMSEDDSPSNGVLYIVVGELPPD